MVVPIRVEFLNLEFNEEGNYSVQRALWWNSPGLLWSALVRHLAQEMQSSVLVERESALIEPEVAGFMDRSPCSGLWLVSSAMGTLNLYSLIGSRGTVLTGQNRTALITWGCTAPIAWGKPNTIGWGRIPGTPLYELAEMAGTQCRQAI